ncbi:uncharacterized protein CLUP02_08316 [Colletotrichum lupini]|uniref:Uncharacterized protein n=1 Tax=Colletotrichum lupini TaxID=145971 RepID=A0A9Q8SU33_9PEZI|nr:uncharacterized protein CLUP02_08316 [Colletotrichum lupini]UQC82826.1 hypothetical protein CLUP02_08316 [Colletotrichum lupini]
MEMESLRSPRLCFTYFIIAPPVPSGVHITLFTPSLSLDIRTPFLSSLQSPKSSVHCPLILPPIVLSAPLHHTIPEYTPLHQHLLHTPPAFRYHLHRVSILTLLGAKTTNLGPDKARVVTALSANQALAHTPWAARTQWPNHTSYAGTLPPTSSSSSSSRVDCIPNLPSSSGDQLPASKASQDSRHGLRLPYRSNLNSGCKAPWHRAGVWTGKACVKRAKNSPATFTTPYLRRRSRWFQQSTVTCFSAGAVPPNPRLVSRGLSNTVCLGDGRRALETDRQRSNERRPIAVFALVEITFSIYTHTLKHASKVLGSNPFFLGMVWPVTQPLDVLGPISASHKATTVDHLNRRLHMASEKNVTSEGVWSTRWQLELNSLVIASSSIVPILPPSQNHKPLPTTPSRRLKLPSPPLPLPLLRLARRSIGSEPLSFPPCIGIYAPCSPTFLSKTFTLRLNPSPEEQSRHRKRPPKGETSSTNLRFTRAMLLETFGGQDRLERAPSLALTPEMSTRLLTDPSNNVHNFNPPAALHRCQLVVYDSGLIMTHGGYLHSLSDPVSMRAEKPFTAAPFQILTLNHLIIKLVVNSDFCVDSWSKVCCLSVAVGIRTIRIEDTTLLLRELHGSGIKAW